MAVGLVIKKAANAFFVQDVRLDPTAWWLANYETRGLFRGINKFFIHLLGGTWIGGDVSLFQDVLSFAPNGMNRELLDRPPSLEIPLASVREVTVKPGFITNIVDVQYGD